MPKRSLFHNTIATELARRELTHRELARLLCVAPSTLSDWLREVSPAPADLRARIAKALDLSENELPERPHHPRELEVAR